MFEPPGGAAFLFEQENVREISYFSHCQFIPKYYRQVKSHLISSGRVRTPFRRVCWASWDDYPSHHLSIDYRMENTGSGIPGL